MDYIQLDLMRQGKYGEFSILATFGFVRCSGMVKVKREGGMGKEKMRNRKASGTAGIA